MIERLRPILIDESGLETDEADRILRRLLEAMREPTDAMLAAMQEADTSYEAEWQAGIDAALSEERTSALKDGGAEGCRPDPQISPHRQHRRLL